MLLASILINIGWTMVLFQAKNYLEELDLIIKNKFEKLETEKKLAIINIGKNKASEKFIEIKTKVANSYGIEVELFQFKTGVKKSDVFDTIHQVNESDAYGGLVIQYPFSPKFEYNELAALIAPEKDVDFFNPITFGNFALSTKEEFMPPTVRSLDFIINTFKMETKGQIFTVLGQGSLVGRPVASYALNQEATLVSINEFTENKDKILGEADILICASGVPNSVKGEQLKRGACVIDFGSGNNEHPGIGDFDVNSDQSHLSVISPAPGGVGPLTVRYLFLNFLEFIENFQ